MSHEKCYHEANEAFIVTLICFLVGCSGSPTQAKSSAGDSPPAPEYSLAGDGGGYANSCGRTYVLKFPLPDGGYATKEVPVYCTIWDGDFGDPPPDEVIIRQEENLAR